MSTLSVTYGSGQKKGGEGGFVRASFTFYVCNTDPFSTKALQGPRFRKASEYARLIRETTSESNFREGKKAVQVLGVLESASQILQPITLRAP